uniref:Uncharacterized protein n=1 Tax=Anopheles albimanus TaxID=7167 RepID=A0A182FFU8_ANOAL
DARTSRAWRLSLLLAVCLCSRSITNGLVVSVCGVLWSSRPSAYRLASSASPKPIVRISVCDRSRRNL